MKIHVQSLTSLSGLGIQYCHELWCRLKTRLGSHITVPVPVARSCSSDLTPSLGASILIPKKKKKEEEEYKSISKT